jgi:hypothetical protein
MEIKLIEVRDRATCMPVLAIKLQPEDSRQEWLLARAGFGSDPYVVYIPLVSAPWDPFEHGDRTRVTSHRHLVENWDSIVDGAVVDVSHILGETSQPCKSDQSCG